MGTLDKLDLSFDDPASRKAFLTYVLEVRKTRSYVTTSCGATLGSAIATFPLYGSTSSIGLILEGLAWLMLLTSLYFGVVARLRDVEIHLDDAGIESAHFRHRVDEYMGDEDLDVLLADIKKTMVLNNTKSFRYFDLHFYLFGAAIPVLIVSRLISSVH